jgi:hypothetical protein
MQMIRSTVVFVLGCLILGAAVSCRSIEQSRPRVSVSPVASPTPEPPVSWTSSPVEWTDNEELKRAWIAFERSQPYRLAQPSDRRLSPEAMARVESNNPNQIIPFLTWWGARGYQGKDFLVAIVVDPSRSDPNRYGLVVIAAPESVGRGYRPYWVMRDEDLESYLISPASGYVYIECFRRDGTEETRNLV